MKKLANNIAFYNIFLCDYYGKCSMYIVIVVQFNMFAWICFIFEMCKCRNVFFPLFIFYLLYFFISVH